jgi:hypothetical protein
MPFQGAPGVIAAVVVAMITVMRVNGQMLYGLRAEQFQIGRII